MMTKMKKLNHHKRLTWIHRFGQDMNLAGTGSQSRIKNNCLVDTLELQELDDDKVQFVMKPATKRTAATKRNF